MSTTVSIQFTDEQMKGLEREAHRLGKSPEDAIARLVEELLRMSEFPRIEFRDSAGDRETYLRGTRLKVWHLRWYSDFDDSDIPQIAADFNVTQETVADAFAYGRKYADEIEASLAMNRHIADNIEQYIPGIQVFRVDATDS